MLELLLFLCISIPVAWLVSEFQSRRWIRVVLGIAALSIVGLVSYGWAGFLTTFTSNLNFSETTKALLVAVADGLESDDSERVRGEIRRFAMNYQPSYERSCDEEVKRFIAKLEAINSQERVRSGNGEGD